MAIASKYSIKNPKKYNGDASKPLHLRSMWERKMAILCDENPAVLAWSFEEVVIQYVSPVDGQRHRYIVDFWMKMKDQSGKVHTRLIEIKPKAQVDMVKPMGKGKRAMATWMENMRIYSINQAKWEAARKFCKVMGWNFMVLDETHIFNKGSKE